MSMERLPFERRPRNSIANNLDRINELVDWVNLDTHLYASASGERVTVDDASSVKGLTVDGRSVQDGTPTPDTPVAVQVVEGRNFADTSRYATNSTTEQFSDFTQSVSISGITFSRNEKGQITVSGTATSNATLYFPLSREIPVDSDVYISGCPNTQFRVTVCATDNSSVAVLSDAGSGAHGLVSKSINRSRLYIPSGTVISTPVLVSIQVEIGGFTPFAPYGCIGLQISDTVTPIDLQGNILASLPDGTHDELHVDSTGRVWIDKQVGHTTQAVTDGVTGTVGTDVLSSTGQIADGADVWYKLASSQTIDLGYITPPVIPSGSVVSISASLTPEFTLEWWVDDGITALVNDLITYVDYKTEG